MLPEHSPHPGMGVPELARLTCWGCSLRIEPEQTSRNFPGYFRVILPQNVLKFYHKAMTAIQLDQDRCWAFEHTPDSSCHTGMSCKLYRPGFQSVHKDEDEPWKGIRGIDGGGRSNYPRLLSIEVCSTPLYIHLPPLISDFDQAQTVTSRYPSAMLPHRTPTQPSPIPFSPAPPHRAMI
jgi:hypothetical protein